MKRGRRAWGTIRTMLWALGLVLLAPRHAHTEGIVEALSGTEEAVYSLFSSTAKDTATGLTTKTNITTYGSRTTLGLNFDVLPKLNLNAGGSYEKIWSEISGDVDSESEISHLRPYVWLNFRDPVIGGSVGYDLAEDRLRSSGQQVQELTRETYTGNFLWRPVDLPSTQVRYIRSSLYDGRRELLDATQDNYYIKTEYLYQGLQAYYTWNRLDTRDNLRDLESQQTIHEGKLLYTTSLFGGRVSLTTDNRIRHTELVADTGIGLAGVDTGTAIPQPPVGGGLSALDPTPTVDPLAANPALVDGDVATSAGVNIGYPGPGLAPLRNIGLDFSTPVPVTSLRVWVSGFAGALPAEVTSFFTWQVYVSSDNLNWTLHATVPAAPFGPFDPRWTITFPSVTTRYIKLVTAPLPALVGGVDTSVYTTIFVTELQAFVDVTASGAAASNGKLELSQTVRLHNLDVRVLLLRIPSLYYRFNGQYEAFDPQDEYRYLVSNGLTLLHRFNPVLSTNASLFYDVTRDRKDVVTTGILYSAALTATPLRTLTDSLVVSGNRQESPDITNTTNSVILYNTAQLYRGFDVTANFGAVLTTAEEPGSSTKQRELYVNIGTGITPHPALTLSTYYLGRLLHVTREGAAAAAAGDAPSDTTENRLDLNLSFIPFPTLALTAAISAQAKTDEKPLVTQNYGVSWSPFPDGNLQLAMYYFQNFLPDETTSRIVQPTIRWYFNSRRRSYLEATYQLSTTDSPTVRVDSTLFSTRMYLAF